MDEQFDEIAQAVPHFAGVSGGSPLTVYVTDGSYQTALDVRELAARVLGDPSLENAEFRVRQVAYTWLELREWHGALSEHVWDLSSVVSIDIDETRNALVIGTTDPAQTDLQVAQLAEELGIPAGAFIVSGSSLPVGISGDSEGAEHGVAPMVVLLSLGAAAGGSIIYLLRKRRHSRSSHRISSAA